MAQQRYFPTQKEQEKIFLLIRKHWWNYVLFFFLTFMSLLPVIAVIVYLNINAIVLEPDVADIVVMALSAFFLLVMAVELYGFVDYYLDIYIVTDQRLVDISQLGLFRRQISELQIRQVQDVSAHVEGIFPTVLHFGDVYIQTAAERENFIFQSIPHPYTVAKQIVDLHEKDVESAKRKTPPVDTSGYSEESLERGFMTKKVEAQAKEMIWNRKAAVKPGHGFYVAAHNTDLVKTLSKKKQSKTQNLIELEGELQEGKEARVSK